jgi:hypothetical protein
MTNDPDELTVPVNQENVEDETMKLNHLAMAAALSAAVVGSPAAYGSGNDADNMSAPSHDAHHAQVRAPEWPNNGIAERELGDGEDTWPENMFVEHEDGRWIVWVLMSPVHGPAKAIDFFSGEVVSAKVKKPGEYNDSFVDAQGITHKSVVHPAFSFKDPRPGGGLGDIDFSGDTLTFGADVPCAPFDLKVSRRMASDDETAAWSKVPLYKTNPWPEACPGGVWDSFVSTALDLRDGTMLITAGKYIFRVRQADMSPVGEAPHLNVVDEVDVRRVMEQAAGGDIKDVCAHLTAQLHLH